MIVSSDVSGVLAVAYSNKAIVSDVFSDLLLHGQAFCMYEGLG